MTSENCLFSKLLGQPQYFCACNHVIYTISTWETLSPFSQINPNLQKLCTYIHRMLDLHGVHNQTLKSHRYICHCHFVSAHGISTIYKKCCFKVYWILQSDCNMLLVYTGYICTQLNKHNEYSQYIYYYIIAMHIRTRIVIHILSLYVYYNGLY